ncbi:MAG: hypothetical protein GWP68_08480 [Verrucomicrobiaceae bacterium]|nr:hypothetical protein [Verrucomicrobiaceae bacterium]
MNYPLNLSFKIVAIAPQIYVSDAQGSPVCFVKQKLFKLKEDIIVFSDSSKSRQIDPQGGEIGSIGRRGFKSIWRASYDVFNPGDDSPDFSIHEENPWTKVLDSILGDIPILGFLSGYFLHPAYTAARPDGTPVMRVQKQPAFFEGKFTIEKLADLTPQEELNLVYSFLMLLLLERDRG